MTSTGELSQVFYRYALAFDEGDFELFGRCFTDDAIFETAAQSKIVGRSAIVEYFQGRRLARESRGEQARHLINNVVVLEEHGTEVVAVAYVTNLVTTNAESLSFQVGWYRDRLVKDSAGVWRIKEHFIHDDGSDRPNPILAAASPPSLAAEDGPAQ